MPPFSRTVEDEGALIDNVKLVEAGRLMEDRMRRILAEAARPARNISQNLADLRAQVAANEKGARELRKMVAHYGLDVVRPTCATSRTTRKSRCAASWAR